MLLIIQLFSLDDYRLTACLAILKWVVEKHETPVKEEEMDLELESKEEHSNENVENPTDNIENNNESKNEKDDNKENVLKPPVTTVSPRTPRKSVYNSVCSLLL